MADVDIKFLNNFGAGLDTAVGDRLLPNPGLACVNPNETDSSAYIRAIRARLIELGYLGEGIKFSNRRDEKLDPVLSKKIKRFQSEAGIKEDGWAGPETWRVLECLVSFENQQDPEHWRKVWKTPENLLSNQAVLRGVYCRLYAMGFFVDWDRDRINTKTVISPSDNQNFQLAIQQFCRFAKQLKLVHPSCADLSVELLIALYEYDKIVASLGKNDCFSQVSADFQHNIEAVARIELWLLGYDIAPGKEQTEWKNFSAGKKSRSRKKISKTRHAIESFCADNKDAIPGFVQVDHVTAELMAAFSKFSDESEKDIYVGKQLNDSVSNILADKKSKKEFKNQFKNIANGIFDGIKRVVRWLFRIVKRIVKFTKQYIANIVRCISKRARQFYLDVVKAIDIVYSGMTYLKNSACYYTRPAKIVFSHDRDFDQFCLISPGLQPDHILFDVRQYGSRSRLYAAGLNIVSHLMRMAHRVLKTVSSPFGWLLALLSLSNLANSVKAIRRQIELVRDYELDIEHQQALFSTRIS
jgi:hypothetical protein